MRESKGNDGLGGGSDDEYRHPESEEGCHGAKSHPDVRIVAPRSCDRRPQLCIAQRPQRGEDPREGPDEERDADAVDAQIDAGRWHEDSTSNDGAYNKGDAIQQCDLSFEFNGAGAAVAVIVVVFTHRMALSTGRARGSTTL